MPDLTLVTPVPGIAPLADQNGARPEAAGQDKMTILLVDDQPENLAALEAMLESLGQRILTAYSGREALRLLLHEEVAVILLDVKMADMDGIETAKLIRQRERNRDTPIIFLTAADMSEDSIFQGYALGAVDYLFKPIVPGDFVKTKVQVFVQLARANAMLRQQAAQLKEREAAARELAERQAVLLEELEQKNRELESFSYSVSHDLRTPLRSIEGFTQLLLKRYGDVLDGEGREFLNQVVHSGRQMAELIEDILMLSRVTLVELRRDRVDLSTLATGILRDLARDHPERQVATHVEPGLMVQADDGLLRTAMTNLLGNAWKFTSRRDGGRIEVGTEPHGSGRAYYVRDNGVGFDASYADKLFMPFQRLHAAAEYPGTGVGLATVHRIVRRHGGKVWAESSLDGGATFYFTL